MQVSRSGQMRTPCIQASSPTLTTAVSSWSPAGPGGGPANWPRPSKCCTPSRNRAPPTPPTRTVTFTSTDTRPSVAIRVARAGAVTRHAR